MNNKTLVAVDTSYFAYYVLYGALNIWKKSSPHAHILKHAEDTDQNNLPDLTKYPDFCKILQKFVMKRLDTILWVLKSNIQENINTSEDIDIFLCLDAPIKTNWRKKIYPQYKAQRKAAPKIFDTYACINYIINVIFKKIDVENKYGFQILSAKHAEGDDIIAILIKNLNEYNKKIIIASDKDFLQLSDVSIYDLAGKEKSILPEIEQSITPKQYTIFKSIAGDPADNIPRIFNRCGKKTILKYINDPEKLKEKFKEDPIAFEQFKLNKKIIDFDNIPSTLITEVLSSIVPRKKIEDEIDLTDIMML
jgi:5'-3' exonuclease